MKKKTNNSDFSEEAGKKKSRKLSTSKQVEVLRPFVSEHKQELTERILEDRTRAITVVLEDIYHPQNASAVIRTCECFGIQDLFFIEDKHLNETSPRVVQGSDKWMTLRTYRKTDYINPTEQVLKDLKSRGYTLYGTSLGENSVDIDEVPLHEKCALVFGTELTGISQTVQEYSDYQVRLPMYGFTDSYNLSVSVALALQTIIKRFKQKYSHWSLSTEEKELLRLDWFKKVVNRAELILDRAE